MQRVALAGRQAHGVRVRARAGDVDVRVHAGEHLRGGLDLAGVEAHEVYHHVGVHLVARRLEGVAVVAVAAVVRDGRLVGERVGVLAAGERRHVVAALD